MDVTFRVLDVAPEPWAVAPNLVARVRVRESTGEPVHAEYRVLASCAGSPSGPCFTGTIRVTGESDHQDPAQPERSA